MKDFKIVGQIDLSKFENKANLKPNPETKYVPVCDPFYPRAEIHFFADKNKKIVGRLSSGKIAIISFTYTGEWVRANETWLCDIILEEEKKAIVIPLECVISSEQNFTEAVDKVKELKENGFKKEFTKPKNSFLFWISK